MKNALVALLAFCSLSGSAVAADLAFAPINVGVVTLPAPAAFSWTGGYVGLQAGYAHGEAATFANSNAFAVGDVSGWLAGLYAGHNFQMDNNVVLGLEADVAWGNVGAFVQGTGPGGVVLPPQSGMQYDTNWSGAARVKLGFALDRLMPYVAGGVAITGMNAQAYAAGAPGDAFSNTMIGWTIGAGVEYAVTDNLIGRLEYRYTDFGQFDISSGGVSGQIGLKKSDVRVGLSYKF